MPLHRHEIIASDANCVHCLNNVEIIFLISYIKNHNELEWVPEFISYSEEHSITRKNIENEDGFCELLFHCGDFTIDIIGFSGRIEMTIYTDPDENWNKKPIEDERPKPPAFDDGQFPWGNKPPLRLPIYASPYEWWTWYDVYKYPWWKIHEQLHDHFNPDRIEVDFGNGSIEIDRPDDEGQISGPDSNDIPQDEEQKMQLKEKEFSITLFDNELVKIGISIDDCDCDCE